LGNQLHPFLPILSRENFKVESDHGTESEVRESVDFLDKFLRSHQAGLEFQAVLRRLFKISPQIHTGTDVRRLSNAA